MVWNAAQRHLPHIALFVVYGHLGLRFVRLIGNVLIGKRKLVVLLCWLPFHFVLKIDLISFPFSPRNAFPVFLWWFMIHPDRLSANNAHSSSVIDQSIFPKHAAETCAVCVFNA